MNRYPVIVSLFLILVTAVSGQPAAGVVECFRGESRVSLPPKDGQPGQLLGVMGMWVRRTVNPDAGQIVEEAMVVREGTPPHAFTATMIVSGNRFTVTEKDGWFEGSGTLAGDAWHWTSWESDVKLRDGTRLVSRDRLEATRLLADKQLFGADGALRVVFAESYEPVDPAEYDREYARQFPAPDAAPPPVTTTDWPEALGGREGHTITGTVRIIQNFQVPQLHRTRRIWVYLPPGYETSGRRYPVLYMQDGQNVFDAKTSYAGEWHVDETLERLFAAGKSRGVIVVAIENAGSLRMGEYTPAALFDTPGVEGDRYAEFVVRTLKPYVDKHFRTLPDRNHTGVAGSSAGAFISFYIGVKYPEVFSRVGAFSFTFGGDFMMSMTRLRRDFPRRQPMRIYLHVGTEEDISREITKESFVANLKLLHRELREMGYGSAELKLDVVKGGHHNEADWTRRFPKVFEWLFK